jgi:hypothetical protein
VAAVLEVLAAAVFAGAFLAGALLAELCLAFDFVAAPVAGAFLLVDLVVAGFAGGDFDAEALDPVLWRVTPAVTRLAAAAVLPAILRAVLRAMTDGPLDRLRM